MLHEGLKRVCANHSGAGATCCKGLAWTYYGPVDKLRSVAPPDARVG